MVEDRDSKWEMKDWPWRMMWTWGVWAGWKAGTAVSELFEIFKETWWSLSVGREDWEVSDSRDVLGPTVFSAERGTQSYRKVNLRVKKTIQLKGGWWSDIEKVVQNGSMLVFGWEGSSRVLWQGNNIFVLLLHPTVRWTAKWAFPRNAKERPEFWAELWRCWFCRL